MTRDQLTEILEAKNVLCRHCKSDMCEWCQVMQILHDSELEFESDVEPYVHCSTNGDYSPSNPWDAPGMSVSDFI